MLCMLIDSANPFSENLGDLNINLAFDMTLHFKCDGGGTYSLPERSS